MHRSKELIASVATALLMAASAAQADTLADVRAAVSALHATTPIHASLDVQRTRKSEGRFANQTTAGRVSISIADDESGLKLTFAPDVMARAARESREHETDPAKTTPTRTALDETQPTDVADMIDFAGPLLNMVASGQRLAELRVARDGRAVRKLTLRLTPKLPPEATSVWHVKFTEDRLDLWIGDDNLPIAAERVRRGSAGFLFLRGDMNRLESWTFQRFGDRLLVIRSESSFAASGLGQRGEGRNIQTLTIR